MKKKWYVDVTITTMYTDENGVLQDKNSKYIRTSSMSLEDLMGLTTERTKETIRSSAKLLSDREGTPRQLYLDRTAKK